MSAILAWVFAATPLPASVLPGVMVGGILLSSWDIRLKVPTCSHRGQQHFGWLVVTDLNEQR